MKTSLQRRNCGAGTSNTWWKEEGTSFCSTVVRQTIHLLHHPKVLALLRSSGFSLGSEMGFALFVVLYWKTDTPVSTCSRLGRSQARAINRERRKSRRVHKNNKNKNSFRWCATPSCRENQNDRQLSHWTKHCYHHQPWRQPWRRPRRRQRPPLLCPIWIFLPTTKKKTKKMTTLPRVPSNGPIEARQPRRTPKTRCPPQPPPLQLQLQQQLQQQQQQQWFRRRRRRHRQCRLR